MRGEVGGVAAFRLGINYWPRRSAMYMWERFDIGEVREDAHHIVSLGFDLVRIFLIWETFSPAANRVDAAALKRLEQTMEAFSVAGLRTIVTLFCGHMSGVNWVPSWALDRATPHGRFRTIASGNISPYGIGDFYADARLLGAQEYFAREVGACLRGHPALEMWDLGNEFSNMREPTQPSDAAAWSARLSEALEASSGAAATGGIHGEDLERDRHIRPSSICAPWPVPSMHGYSVYSAWARDRLDSNVVPYLAQLVQSFSGKAVLFTEFGNPACPPGKTSVGAFACLNDEEMASYATAVLDRLHARGALGALWWCWSDYDAALATLPPFDDAPHEMRFGVVRADGSEKPVARALGAFATQRRTAVPPPPPIAAEAEYYAGLPQTIADDYARYCNDNA